MEVTNNDSGLKLATSSQSYVLTEVMKLSACLKKAVERSLIEAITSHRGLQLLHQHIYLQLVIQFYLERVGIFYSYHQHKSIDKRAGDAKYIIVAQGAFFSGKPQSAHNPKDATLAVSVLCTYALTITIHYVHFHSTLWYEPQLLPSAQLSKTLNAESSNYFMENK